MIPGLRKIVVLYATAHTCEAQVQLFFFVVVFVAVLVVDVVVVVIRFFDNKIKG